MSSSSSDSDIVISVRGLGKLYRIGQLAKTTYTLEDWFVDTSSRVKNVATGKKQGNTAKTGTFWAQ